MSTYYIHNKIAIDSTTIETHGFNGDGNKKVTLKTGQRVDGIGPEWWLETNGDPLVITLDETDWSISIEQAAEMLDKTTDDLRAMMDEHLYT